MWRRATALGASSTSDSSRELCHKTAARVQGRIRLRTLPAVGADAVELRVLGCLIEKQATTPDQYPLSLNALRLAANQSTNRDPVVDYDETAIRAALERLGDRGW